MSQFRRCGMALLMMLSIYKCLSVCSKNVIIWNIFTSMFINTVAVIQGSKGLVDLICLLKILFTLGLESFEKNAFSNSSVIASKLQLWKGNYF